MLLEEAFVSLIIALPLSLLFEHYVGASSLRNFSRPQSLLVFLITIFLGTWALGVQVPTTSSTVSLVWLTYALAGASFTALLAQLAPHDPTPRNGSSQMLRHLQQRRASRELVGFEGLLGALVSVSGILILLHATH